MNDESFKKYILELAKKGMRSDGRKLLEYRQPIEIEYDISNKAEGSCKVTMGKTIVNCGVKLGTGEPYSDKPDEGSLIVNAEYAALSSPDLEPGPPREDAIELARVVDRGIRESGAIDTKKLCIKSGEKIWLAFIDIYIENHDGNLIDASALAAIAALLKAKFPKYDEKEDKVIYDEHTKESIPIVHKPIACTVRKIGEYLIVDPTVKEEKEEDARLTITIDENGTINGMQKGGNVGFSEEEVNQCIDIALEKTKELRNYLK